ncbi:sortase (plasmid) [Clostridium perfringens]
MQTVLPDDTSHFEKVPDKDYITLVTCTPLCVNSHRLLVHGHRVDDSLSNNTNKNINTDKILSLDKKEHFRFGIVKTVIVTKIIVLLFLFILFFILKRKKHK